MSSDNKDMTTDNEPDPAELEFQDEEVAEQADAEQTKTSGGGIIGIVALLLVFLLAAGAYYWYANIYQPQANELRTQISQFDGLKAAIASDVDANIGAALEAADANSQALAGDVEAMRASIDATTKAQSELKRSVSALYEKETQSSVDFVLAEAEYLALAATQRLALERDVGTAIAALQAADQRLRSEKHPDLLPIRDQLIKDITALEGVELVDIEGWAITFAKTIDQVDTLPTKKIAEEITPFGSVREGEYAAEDWQRLGHAIWSDLVELVEVKDADMPDSVLFDPELRYFLQQNLKLELASARLSILRGDAANLQASADLIKKQLNNYYNVEDAAVKSIITRLDEAVALDLAPSLPNITGSLDVIRKQRAQSTAKSGGAK